MLTKKMYTLSHRHLKSFHNYIKGNLHNMDKTVLADWGSRAGWGNY